MLILTQFTLRLGFGLALSMAFVSPRQVTSGYFRNNLYVLLGLNVVVALVTWQARSLALPLWPGLVAAGLSYLGAACWLYEAPRAGRAMLILIAAVSLCGALLATPAASPDGGAAAGFLRLLDPVAGGLLLGVTMAAMLLGHWYLNAPGMPLAPLKWLVLALAGAVALRSLACGAGLGLELAASGGLSLTSWLFVALRWLGGLVASGVLTLMTWQTLKVPNTQSATGILYVGVISAFLGELTSQLLSDESVFPL